MALVRRRSIKQELFFTKEQIAKAPSHPFYSRLETVFRQCGFDVLCEEVCRRYYAEGIGRLGLPPGNYFRLFMLGYFEPIPSARQWGTRTEDCDRELA